MFTHLGVFPGVHQHQRLDSRVLLIPITAAILESAITITRVFLLMIDLYMTLKIQQFFGHRHNRHSTPVQV